MTCAVYPGTFDPFTRGHLDLVERALRLFPRVIVAIADNPQKSPLFTTEERKGIIREATGHLAGVEIDAFHTLLVHYARDRGARVVIRGLRAVSDFEFEFQMALMNRKLADRIETVFLMPHEAYSYLSSRLVKEVAALGGQVDDLVPPMAARLLKERFGGSAPPTDPGGRS
jgi:pantetheine-phosphate adenylyltransferase